MPEPEYAALLFSKLCTLCGSSTTFKPDPYLFARLCASCRDTSLVDYDEAVEKWHIEDLVIWSKSITPNSSNRFCLRRDVERILQRRAEPYSSSLGLTPIFWELKRKFSLKSWYHDSYYLAQYLSGLEQARNQELEAIKNQRRQPIHERLFGLGWTAEDVRVHEAYAKDWNALVEVARPLSDPACTTLIPRLTRFLEGSRQTKGRETRHKRVKDLLIEYSRTAHPFNNILIKFWRFVWYPQPNPLPDMDTLLGWDLIRDLYEADISIDVVNERFKERIPKLEPRLAAWRAKTEKRLIDNLKLERKPGPETQLEVRRETEATKDLPASTRFLLRADTIFKTPTEQGSSHSRSEFGGTSPMLLYYPYLLFSPEDSEVSGTIPLKPTDLSKFTRHTEAEKIAKALLADMRTPHVTYLELQEMGAWFTCLRCHLREPKTWEGMIEHYREMNEKWENETRRRPKQTTKHKIVFANAHELRPRAGIELERLMLPNHLMKRDKEKSPGGMQVVSDWLAFDDIRLHARYNPALAECACGYR